jgi:chromosome segregation ATPase
MKLSRALLERREITKRISRIKEEIEASLVTPDYEEVSEDSINKKIEEYIDDMYELENLNLKIDMANAQYLIGKLNSLRILDSKIDFFKKCRSRLINGSADKYYMRDKHTEKKNISIEEMNEQLEILESERNKLDSEIQEVNWTVEI